MARPTTYDDDLRRRLVEGAADRIAASGVQGLSLRGVAGEQGTTTNAIYTLFGSRAELVGAVQERALAGFVEAQDSVPRTDDPLADLEAQGHAYRSWALENAALYAVLMSGRYPRQGVPGDGWTDDPLVRPLLDGVRRALDAGALVADDPEQVAITLWAGLHGVVSLEAMVWGGLSEAQRRHRFTEHLHALAWRWLAPA